MELWNSELLPSIHSLIKSEIRDLTDKISDLNTRFIEVEESQKFLSSKYDEFLHSLQSTKKNVAEQEQKVDNAVGEIVNVREANYHQDVMIDEVQQYQRRDSLEMTGIPILPDENTKELAIELASAIGG